MRSRTSAMRSLVPKSIVVAALRLELLAQRRHLLAELALLERVGERHFEIGVVERLADEVRRAELHRLDDGRRPALARQHDDRHLAIDLLEGRERFEPVHRAGHHDDRESRPPGARSCSA